jgi:ATP-dependent DNA helicase DinG
VAEQTLTAPSAPQADLSQPGHRRVLDDAVAGIGGVDRPGQHAMADAVAQSFADGRHLLVQAGTGTGKSLGYLAPALVWLTEHPGERIVVATATLALQAQLASSDIPAALDAVEHVTGQRPEFSVLKGRSNYACLLRVRDGGTTDQGSLISADDVAATARPSAA